MTAIETAIELYVNLNIVLVFALVVWLCLRFFLVRTGSENAYALQLGFIKALLLMVAASPLLALGASAVLEAAMPGRSVVLGDIAVAAYLRGEIAMDATRFESLLSARHTWTRDVLALSSPVAAALTAFLVAGVAFCMGRFGLAALGMRRMLAESFTWKRIGSVDIRLSDCVRVPLATRWGRRRIVVLPGDLVTRPKELRFALAHELQHFRQRDIDWEIGFEVLRPLFFWNPAFVILKRRFDQLRELSCDQAVVATRQFDRREYATCLLKFCARSRDDRGQHALNVALVRPSRRRAKHELTDRVLALEATRLRLRISATRLSAAICVSAVAVSFAAASLQRPKDWSHDRLMLSTVVNLERLEAINRGY